MDLIEVEKHKLIVDKSKDLLILLDGENYDFVNKIKEDSNVFINKYNNKNIIVINPTPTEIGAFNSTIKKIIYARYLNPYLKTINRPVDYYEDFEDYVCKEHFTPYTYKDGTVEMYCNPADFCSKCKKEYNIRELKNEKYLKNISDITEIFKKACNETVFLKDLILNHILFRRKLKNPYKLNSLENALKDVLHQQMLMHFDNENKKLIIKYT
jgi:hypothetical protein